MAYSTLLEDMLSTHQELEQLERRIVNELRQNEPKTAHNVRSMIEQVTDTARKLLDTYDTRANEISSLMPKFDEPSPEVVQVMLNEFYKALENPPEIKYEDDSSLAAAEPPIKVNKVLFSGEESYGKFIDLHELYNCFINSVFGEPVEYSAFLRIFRPEKLPRKHRLTEQYGDYLTKLTSYLTDFLRRTQPLLDLNRLFSEATAEFERKWAMTSDTTVEELMVVGAEKLTAALAAHGLKTGGTERQLAKRLFRAKEVALMEEKIEKMCGILEDTIVRTIENVQRKQALTYEEMEMERAEVEEGIDEESDGDDEEEQKKKIYNPLELPMGWDGKPIPYWLYKLHGLAQEFSCEICGDHKYRGRREFEKHFRESRHQFGMSRLGIPNTKNFHEITSIEEARELWKKIQEREGGNKWRPDLDEEYEDEEGNIYNKKIYDDMKRQGLI